MVVGGTPPARVGRCRALLCLFSIAAGWSSQVARRAHNPKVAGSNPAPATNETKQRNGVSFVFFYAFFAL